MLCGKNAVQFAPAVGELPPDLDSVERRLALHEDLRRDSHAVSCTLREVRSPDGGSLSLSVFADGRILVRGTREPEFAKSMVARFVGH